MKHDFEYVPRSEYMPVKKELEELINDVQDCLRDRFTFSFTYIGSTKRRLITRDRKSNVGYDFDINLHLNIELEDYTPKQLKEMIMKSFNKFCKDYGYDYCEDSTRVITIKRKDTRSKRIISSCDIAIVFDLDDGSQMYIHNNKNQNTYEWQQFPTSEYELDERAEWVKEADLWDELKQLYIEKKNQNDESNRKSRSIYAETVNDMVTTYHFA